jgi:hypothetical protein
VLGVFPKPPVPLFPEPPPEPPFLPSVIPGVAPPPPPPPPVEVIVVKPEPDIEESLPLLPTASDDCAPPSPTVIV